MCRFRTSINLCSRLPFKNCPAPNPKTKTSHSTQHKRGGRSPTPSGTGGTSTDITPRQQFAWFWFASHCWHVDSLSALTSCCRLQPRAPVRCRTGWHRSRAPAPTRWWRRPSSAPRPSARAPCPRLLLVGPPAWLQVREVR